VASIRGLDTQYTLVLIDGQRVAKAALDGGYDLSRIPANAIERIEIIKGPQAILLGGDAIGGVINIITRRTIDATQAAIEGGYGTFNTRAVEGSGQTRLGPVGVSSRVRWEASDGWTDAWDRDLDLQRDYPKNAGRPTARTFAEVGFSGKPTSALTLRQLAQVVVAETVVGGYTDRQTDAGSFFGSRDATDVDLQTTAIYEPTPGNVWQLDLSGFRHDTTVRVGRDKVLWNSGQIASYNFEDERQDIAHQLAGFQLRHRRALGTRQLLTIRAEARGEWRDSDNQVEEEGRDPEGRIVRRATFRDAHRIYDLREIFFGLAVLDEIFLTDAWTVAPGIRVDGTDYWGTVVLPNVTTLHQTTSWLQLRYGLGAGYRRPTFESRTLPPYPVQDLDGQRFLVGNPDLLPEWSVGQEASATVYLGRATPSGAGGLGGLAQPARSGELTLAFFRNDFWNKIEERQAGFYDFGDDGVGTPEERPEVPVVTETNVGRARTQGIEFSINATPIQRWTLGGNATWTSAKHLSDGRPLEGVPPLTANVFTSVRVPWTESGVRFAAIYSSKWERLDVNGVPRRQGPTPARVRLDAQVVQPMGEHLSLRVEVENLANNRWDRDNDGDTDTPPRTWFATVRATY
jgi:outer membrane receptor for ferrienterochelin and colicins